MLRIRHCYLRVIIVQQLGCGCGCGWVKVLHPLGRSEGFWYGECQAYKSGLSDGG